jgi:integrase
MGDITVGRKAKVSLYRLFTVGGKHRYIPIVMKGRGWAPKTEPTGTPGCYYLRYMKTGRRTFESVGDDLQVALQELKARQAFLKAPTPVAIVTQRKTVRSEAQAFLASRPESWRYILGVIGDWYGWDNNLSDFQREDFHAFAAHLTKLRPANKECLAPRTRKNYLKHLTQFLRNTGRVVIVVRNEQDATITKATAVIPNTLVLTRADFPKVNKKVKDYYPRPVVKSMFAAAKNLRELVMLALFFFTGCREDEVAHFRWNDIRWEAKELLVREWWKDNWTTKTYEDRIVEMPEQLIEILKSAHDLLSDPVRYKKEGCLFADKSPLILPNKFGRPDGHLLKKVQQIARRAGIACGECRDCVERKGRNCQNFRLHKFRYTYARVLDEGKTPIEDIRKALGHKDISTTIGYLGGGDKSQRRANIERSFPRKMGVVA